MRKINEKNARKMYGGDIPTAPSVTTWKRSPVVPITPKLPTPVVRATGHSQGNQKPQGRLGR